MGWITAIADNHGRTLPVRPDSYLVLLAGDICPDADQAEWLEGPFRSWLEDLPCPCVAVPGNHDKIFYRDPGCFYEPSFTLLLTPKMVNVAGLKIFGMPWTVDGGLNKCSDRTEDQVAEHLEHMPDDVDILLSHNPPLGIFDQPSLARHLGSLALASAIYRKKPKLCVFGHVHEARGYTKRWSTYCINATLGSGCSGNGKPTKHLYGPWGISDNSWRK